MTVDYRALNKELNKLEAKNTISKLFRVLAGENLCNCANLMLDVTSNYVVKMKNNSEEGRILSESILLDSIVLATADNGESITLCREDSVMFANIMGFNAKLISFKEMQEFVYGELEIVDSTESAGTRDYVEPEEEEPKEEEPQKDVKEESKEKEPEEEEDNEKEEEKKETPESELENAISRYYSQYCNGIIQELLKRYTELFSSGYEVNRPDGLLTKEGIVKVSGSSRVVKEDSVSTTNMYGLLQNNLGFVESPTRSIKGIANEIYDVYSKGKSLLYFPNKMLEFAYGLEAPDGDNQNSTNTYKPHSDCHSWSAYRNSQLSGAVSHLVKRTLVGFVMNTMEDDNYKDPSIINSLGDFLKYLQDCLSLCMLMVNYKTSDIDGNHDVSAFKVRICDPRSAILNKDLTPLILDYAFMGGTGTVPFSYMPRVNTECFVVEYAHEFNHDMAQSTPLFAYKALEALKAQGRNLSFQELILGMAEDESILRGGTHGVDISKNLTHNICAGSQAGKGVMTLNILASGIASRKNIIYLDRKPDMASLFKYLAPNMVVVNGGEIQKGYDSFNQWQNMNEMLSGTSDEVTKAFNVSATWNALGDLVYMRVLKLVLGLLMVRGSGYIGSEFGGEEGILLVVDEFSNFQRSYMSMLSNLTSVLPPITLEKAKLQLEEGKMTKATFNRIYNNTSYYALSYLNSMMEDIRYLKEKKDAGYDPLETARSDIFVIGQTLDKGLFNYDEFKDAFSKNSSSARYKSVDSCGLTKGGFDLGDQSIPFNLVNFKTSDAFFGRNRDDGRDKYLAQTNKKSRANGKLDDKASMFAYLNSFSEVSRKKIVYGSEIDNLNIANNCVYFKPFLILNSSGMGDECVKKMFNRVETNAGISRKELIQENPSYTDPSRINEAVGFIDYIKLAGTDDVQGVLEKSAGVLNHIVQNVLKYPGDWFQFVTDFSPERLFTIRDIVDAVERGTCAFYDPNTNPILAEYVEFNPERFGGSFEDATRVSENAMDKFFKEESTKEDYSDTEEMDRAEGERLADAMGDFDSFDFDEEISLDEPIQLNEREIQETGTNETKEPEDEDTKKILQLLDELAKLGVDIQIGEDSDDKNTVQYTRDEKSEFGEELEDINYDDDIDTLGRLVNLITNGVVNKFGGLDRFKSLRIIGGSIIVNDVYYRCKIKDSSVRKVPYDIRRDINSGNISKLYDFTSLLYMKNIHELEFDSVNFTYDYVSVALGIKANIGVDKFFDKIPSLRVLKIGNRVFTRTKYIEQAKEYGDDIFYKPKKATELADASEEWLGKMRRKSWTFTKSVATNKNYGLLRKSLGITAGTAGTLASGLPEVGTKVARGTIKGIKVLSKSVKNLFNS